MSFFKYLSIVFVFLVSNIVFSQEYIYGEILDEKWEPLAGATIYFDGTSLGTMTDSDGLFTIAIASELNTSLIISFVGYEKVIIPQPKLGTKYKVILKPKLEELNEIVLSDGGFTRKQMMHIFKEQFLGLTKAGRKCTIENENEIYFYYDTKLNRFHAYCDVELVINNPYLGYKVYYDLNRFEVNFKKYSIVSEFIYSSIYSGDSRFVEVDSTSKVKERRKDAFEGSITHFMRELSNANFSSKGFQLYYRRLVTNPDYHFKIIDTLGMKKVSVLQKLKPIATTKFLEELSILYDKKQQSKVIFYDKSFFIDRFGLFTNYENILFSGALTDKRVGDLLPANYGVE
jgi:hypothetical protein